MLLQIIRRALRNPWFGCELRREQKMSDVKMLPFKDAGGRGAHGDGAPFILL